MVLLEIEQRERWENAHRVKLLVQMLTTIGYASAGGALADPIFNGVRLGAGHFVALGWGLVCLVVALYLVPKGERHVSL